MPLEVTSPPFATESQPWLNYLDSMPGPDNSGGNTVIHSAAKRCVAGEVLDAGKLRWLFHCRGYRAGLSKLGNSFFAFVGIQDFPSTLDWDHPIIVDVGAPDTYSNFRRLVLHHQLARLPSRSTPLGKAVCAPGNRVCSLSLINR
jgi:hypothetical protein